MIQAEKGPSPPKKNKKFSYVLNWLLDKIQCFSPINAKLSLNST